MTGIGIETVTMAKFQHVMLNAGDVKTCAASQ